MSGTTANEIELNKLPKLTLERLSDRISEAVQTRVTPSVSIAVFHYDTPIFKGAWGWLDPEEKQLPTSPKTLFDLASITKIYTTLAFFTLITEKKTYLHAPVVNTIPEFAESGLRSIDGGQDPHSKEALPTPPDLANQQVDPSLVNFFHLLTHTSGLPPWRDVYTVADAPSSPTVIHPSRAERWQSALKKLTNYPFVGLPDNATVRYSDIGLMLLGEAVARLHAESGQLDTAIADRVLMDRFDHTLFNPMQNGYQREQIAPTEYDATWRKRRVWGEVHDENACGLGGVAGHAGLFSTAFEVALLGNMWLNHTEKLLKIDPELAGASTELQAQTGNELRGLGWSLKSPEGSSAGDKFSPQSYGHTGFTGTSLWIDPREKLVVALLTNRVYDGREKIGIYSLRRDVHDIIADFVQS